MVKGIAAFVSGAVVGSVVTYILMKNQQKKVEADAQVQIDLIKKDYSWKKDEPVYSASTEEIDEESEGSEDDDEEDHRGVYNYAAKSEKMRRASRERHEEKKIFRSVKNQDYLDDLIGEEDDEDDYGDGEPNPYAGYGDSDIAGDHPSEGPMDDPYSISADTFANTCNHFDKCTLIWYAVDDILADDENERIVDFSIVGYDWREHVGEFEKDVAYIRNEAISVDYEIIKEDLSFFKDAL